MSKKPTVSWGVAVRIDDNSQYDAIRGDGDTSAEALESARAQLTNIVEHGFKRIDAANEALDVLLASVR